MPFYALPYHIGVWKGMAGHKKGNGYKLEESPSPGTYPCQSVGQRFIVSAVQKFSTCFKICSICVFVYLYICIFAFVYLTVQDIIFDVLGPLAFKKNIYIISGMVPW